MTFRSLLVLTLLASCVPLSAPARGQDVRSLQVHRLAPGAAPRIDGRLDEAVWKEADVAKDFVQSEPAPGVLGTERTEARVLYDDNALYVGVTAYAADPSTLVRRLVRRDDFGETSDRIFIEIGSPADGRTAYSFGINLAGARQDAILSDDSNTGDINWDPVWDSAVRPLASGGYAVEVRIPFSQIRFDPRSGRPWQFNVQRDIAAKGEVVYWSPISPEVDGYVSQFGTLAGLEGLRSPRRAELLPYAATRLTRAPEADPDDPFYEANAFTPRVGLDARLGLTSGLTLTATVNPDFGQVEVDPAVVNLSQFEDFFAERRPFFVEGTDVFNFGSTRGRTASERPTFFYSRRIGGEPSSFFSIYADTVSASTPNNERFYVRAPEQTTILGAAKLSGQVGPWTIGLLEAVTNDEDADFITASGRRSSLPVAPLANYLIARAQRNWRGGRTVAGGFVSSVIRDTRNGAFTPFLASTATVGGIDLETATADRSWTFSAVGAGSAVAGETAVISALQTSPQRYYQRVDASYLDLDPDQTLLSGYRAEAALAKTGGGRHWRGSLTLGATSPGFESNDLGFQERADFLSADWEARYNVPSPAPSFLNYATIFANGSQGFNYGGDHILQNYNLGTFVRFSNLWGAQVIGTVRPSYFNDRLTRGGPLAQRPPDASISTFLGSNGSKRLSGTVSIAARREFDNPGVGVDPEWTFVVRPRLTFRPTDVLTLSLEPDWVRAYNTDLYRGRQTVASGEAGEISGRRYLFVDYRLESLDLGMRVDWAFSPDLTLQLVAVPKVDALEFGTVRTLETAASYDFLEEDGGVAPYGDYTRLSLRGNAVLRWEWRPGSTVFFVWQQVRDEFEDFGGLDVLYDVNNVFSGDLTNVFLIKASYWFGL